VSEENVKRIAGWCKAADDLSMDGTTVTVTGEPPIEVTVESGDDAIVLKHTHSVGEAHDDFAGHAKALLGGRGSMLEGEVATDKDGTRVEIRYPIYLDGLNRQTFLLAIRDITSTADRLAGITADAAADEPVEQPATRKQADEPGAESGSEPEPATAETVVVDAATGWAPTHTVPGDGMSAWAEPDPGLAPIAKLSARVELQVNEQRGAWARVTGSNGWTGWVDARKLRPLAAAPSGRVPITQAAPAAIGTAAGGSARSVGLTIQPPAVIGGLAMIVGSLPFLKWLPTPNFDASGWDAGLGWLWQGSLANPRLGLVMTLLGIAAIGVAFLPRLPRGALVAIGLAGTLVTALFAFQVVRVLAGSQWQVLWDGGIGFGWWIAFLGSILTVIPFKMKL